MSLLIENNIYPLKSELVRRFYNILSTEHLKELETFLKVSKFYWWPGLRKFIKAYIKGCDKCQQFKIIRNPIKLALMPILALVAE